MIWYVAFVLLRLAAVAFFLLTTVYGVVAYTPFAYETFIRPQLMPWLTTFVAWHHVWYMAAYAASVVSLLPDLASWRSVRPNQATKWVARAYVGIFGAVGAYLIVTPYLPTIGNDSRSLVAALVSLVPLLILAAIDHLAVHRTHSAASSESSGTTAQRRLLAACLAAAAYVWIIHLVRASAHGGVAAGIIAWLLTGAWALVLDLTVFMIVYATLSLVTALAVCTRAPRAWEHGLTVGLLAAGICELLRRIALPSISMEGVPAALVAVTAGVSMAAMWSGLALRLPRKDRDRTDTAVPELLAPGVRRRAVAIVALAVLPLLAFAALDRIERLDWDFVFQKLIIAFEWTLAFGLLLRLFEGIREQTWSVWTMAIPPILTLTLLLGMPRVASTLAERTGNPALDSEIVLDRAGAADLSVRFIAGALIEHPGLDADYFRYLMADARISRGSSAVIPAIELADPGPPLRRPHIFLFAIDSLRRDYLSPYNPAVTFTPNFGRFAAESFVFRNAFTRYGGTQLGMPSIWMGGPVIRKFSLTQIDRMNAIEKLSAGDGYRFLMNEHTVSGYLRPSTGARMLDPEVLSVDTDLCRLLGELETEFDHVGSSDQPVFTFLAPMNVHILNTRSRSGDPASSDAAYPGFYAPYATRMRRIDACFGRFISYLKDKSLYDNSIIVVTGDHGDSLGEGGNWGHAFGLFPEDVRLPLVMHIPSSLATTWTTDLGRIAFSTDIAPTLYALTGHRVRDLGLLFGAPLFVPADEAMPPRRRESFLLTSSYGPTYGLLRRNGRTLYVSDLVERREFAFDLSTEPLGTRVDISDDLRRVNQRLIRDRISEVAAFYHFTP